ncbi:MAG: SDR family oxidoreductase [Alphaproteobacteria bacterium]|nr:SDR family oxidoreductase [Alphaproteobacteria bacterium]
MQAVVTGATSGIGKAIALALREEGYDVFALGRRTEALVELEALGIKGIQVDLANREATRLAVQALQPDVLVNNAGIMPPLVNFCETRDEDIDQAIAVNIASVIYLTRMLAPAMRQRRSGHIFFTGSTAGHAPFANLAVYCATKAAIAGFAQALRLDLASTQVRVTEIVAGRVETDLYKNLLSLEARAAMYAGHSAVQPKDVATMVLAVLALPASVDVARFDILPTQPAAAMGAQNKDK